MRLRLGCLVVCLWGSSCLGGGVADGDCPEGEIEVEGDCRPLCADDGVCASDAYCGNGVCLDGVRPQIAAHSPAADAADVATDAAVFITFSVAMEPVGTSQAFSVTGPQGPVAGDLTWNDTHLILTFLPATPWREGATYRVQVSQTAMSAASVPLAGTFSFSFTVLLPPVAILSMTPVPGSINQGLATLVSVTFSVPMDPVSASQAFHLLANGNSETAGNANLNPGGTVLTFTPGANLAGDTLYAVRVDAGARSAAGASLGETWERTFRTTAQADIIVPNIAIDAPTAGVISTPDLNPPNSTGGFTFTGTASDSETQIDWVQVQVVAAGQPVGDAWVAADIATPGASVSWSYGWYPSQMTPLPNGTYILYARALDLGGNSRQTSVVFQADLVLPPQITFVSEPKTTWKFRTLPINISGETDSVVEVRLNNNEVPGSPFPLGPDGVEALSVDLPSLGSYTLALFSVDLNGNRNPLPTGRVVNRIAYTCLSSGNGFPLPAATVVAASFVDDENGRVNLTYELSTGIADDTYIANWDSSPNGSNGNDMPVDTTNRILFYFNNDLLPACATLSAARLRLATWSSWSGSIDAKPLLRAWDEETATWQYYAATSDWEGEGASGVTDAGPALGSFLYDTGPNPDRGVLDLTLTARGWASGATANHGIVILSTNGNASFFPTETYNGASYRPHLELQLVEPE
jgi:hypothetical protein